MCTFGRRSISDRADAKLAPSLIRCPVHTPARMPRSTPPPAEQPAPAPVTLDLALQGGGSHGAFTWGVLDRLLEDETIRFDGVSGASAGAMNAAVLASGWAHDGHRGAQAALRAFWLDVAAKGACFGNPAAMGMGLQSWLQGFVMQNFSPYQFNPFDINPLRDVLREHVDPQALRDGPLSLFVTATAVQSGQPRVFDRRDLTLDALLASACLPQLFQAVKVDGEPYWDGGYSGNPALWPLIYGTQTLDVLLIKINPLHRAGVPDTPGEIADRINEITFNAGLVAEMRAIGFVQRLIAQGSLQPGSYKNLRLHMVADEKGLAELHPASKLDTRREFLERLHAMGRHSAGAWLKAHRADLGQRSSMDPAVTFLAPQAPE